LEIPQGAAITSAFLEVEPAASTQTINMRILAAGFNSSGLPIENFTSGLPQLEDRLDYIDGSIDWNPGIWTSSVRFRHKSPDIAPLIQGIISNSNWASGNFISIVLDYMWSNTYQASYRIKGAYGSTYAADELPRLFVEYLVPLPTDTAYIMQYEKDITIDYTQVAATLTDFPVLIDIYDSDLRTDVQADGDDITFMKNDQALDFEIELFNQSFNSSHAHLVAWVKVPTLSDSVDTVLRMLYGNPGAKSSSSTKVWDEYETVHHLNQDPSGTQYDSTANNHDGTSYGTLGSEDAVDGRIDGAIDFTNETSDVISIGQVDTNAWTSFTASIWVKMDEADDVRVFSKSYSTTSTQHIMTTRIEFDHFSMRFWTDGYGGQEHDAGTTLTLAGMPRAELSRDT
jgi:hypothetical protein